MLLSYFMFLRMINTPFRFLLKVVDILYKCISIKEGLCFGKNDIWFDTMINIMIKASKARISWVSDFIACYKFL